ncbi:MAG: alanine racemase [Acidobacteria bacterium]|nr:alanine racemase [Acidobacteriota bacterium]
MLVTGLPTPQILVDRRRLLKNIDSMQAAVAGAGLRLRPHAKTHKSPTIAAWQIERGAVGICCAKTGEAEVFAGAGVEDVRLPYPVNPSNAGRLIGVMDRAHVSIIVDHADVARGWSDAMRRAERTLDVLVKVDVGFHRCGLNPAGPAAAAFVADIAGLPHLRFRGLLSHAGQAYTAQTEEEIERIARQERDLLLELAGRVRARGIDVEEISVGSTPSARYSVRQEGLTEMRPGNYVYFDRSQVALGAATLAECALTVMASVVSKPADDRIILDCGSKTLTTDGARGLGQNPAGYGTVLSLESDDVAADLVIERLSEEHATVRVTGGSTSLKPGDRVRVLPNHSCVVSNLADSIRLVDGLEVVDTLPIAARGKNT